MNTNCFAQYICAFVKLVFLFLFFCNSFHFLVCSLLYTILSTFLVSVLFLEAIMKFQTGRSKIVAITQKLNYAIKCCLLIKLIQPTMIHFVCLDWF